MLWALRSPHLWMPIEDIGAMCLNSALQHDHRNTRGWKVFWTVVHPSSIFPETWRINAGGLCRPNNLLKTCSHYHGVLRAGVLPKVQICRPELRWPLWAQPIAVKHCLNWKRDEKLIICVSEFPELYNNKSTSYWQNNYINLVKYQHADGATQFVTKTLFESLKAIYC